MKNKNSRLVRLMLSVFFGVFLLAGCNEVEKPRLPSASENVEELSQTFTMAELNRDRTIRLYLPPDYSASDKRYPVLYMHDGQNLFDDATSYVGEWGVDETLNRLFQEKGLGLIVVGIDNGQKKRMSELSPWKNDNIEAVEGAPYMNFIVNQIKPFIDQNYRTLPDADNTAVMGSSMGGLISHYAIFQFPQVFSKAGIFSPSYWVSDKIYDFSQPEKLAKNSRLYLLMGGNEGVDVVDDFQSMNQYLKEKGLNSEQLKSKIVADGEHNEGFWRSEFAEAVLWLFRK